MVVDSWNKPKIRIPKTKPEWAWDIAGYTFYIGSVLLLVFVWNTLPEEVPAHYNAAGEVNRWGSKYELFILPIVGAFTAVFMAVFERFPEIHSYPKRLNESNAKEFYLNSRKILNQVKNICLIIFALILFESVSIAAGWGSRIGMWFLPLVIVGTCVPIVTGLIRQRKIR
ncbi:DUF1648 domain-containing protein [Evansella sp. LMS18]|jgi:uncharacterized membrane protein|uniref:DUF1648 domain-containing protein n=1 Tax=Evansella sp. LMS18 TaxID=2924033 RepID=UPI0020D0C644|nr:DUF1648 domain-containing protein [Evansella sp. LMS18]UTR12784.1 DUF1648 domain-containing protein [Evansella sp. LMS18]